MFVFAYKTVVAPAGVVKVCQTSSFSVPKQVASGVPVAPSVEIVAFIQLPFEGIVGSAIAPEHSSFEGTGGGGGAGQDTLLVCTVALPLVEEHELSTCV